MSSAKNHVKRSHRSEQFKTSTFNAQARRTYIREATKPKQMSLFGKLASMFHRKNANG